jgi:hypothetical protein
MYKFIIFPCVLHSPICYLPNNIILILQIIRDHAKQQLYPLLCTGPRLGFRREELTFIQVLKKKKKIGPYE